ncbi:Transcriptional regulator, AraC family (plasmid) [Azotobacter chroococcum NCIMB 8003]|uniref:Transcriptional regulator, AraC family n=2 Tax=Azotobacter chroococcum TaxID=353 RepID=A0A0C4WTH7_9GAMM|nr:Transcriptional regulator, AraC family [Azotobacter chroococcum NCIMB 8003]
MRIFSRSEWSGINLTISHGAQLQEIAQSTSTRLERQKPSKNGRSSEFRKSVYALSGPNARTTWSTKLRSFGQELRDKTLPLAQHPELGSTGWLGLPNYVRELVAHRNYISITSAASSRHREEPATPCRPLNDRNTWISVLAKSVDRRDYESADRPIVVMAKDYPAGHVVPRHTHACGQLIYAVSGIMEVRTDSGLWLVPPQRALWMPAGIAHAMRTRSSPLALRTAYVRVNRCPADAPEQPSAVQVSSLLRELILRAAAIALDYPEDSRDSRILGLILEEITWSPEQRLHLPTGRDRRLAAICEAILAHPQDNRTLDDWASQHGATARTLSRLFTAELGVPFRIWRQQARVMAALPRLAAGEPVTVVALEMGYDTPGAFSSMFKRLLGESPSRYFP